MLQFLVFLRSLVRGISCVNFCKYESPYFRQEHDDDFSDFSGILFQLERSAEYAPYQRPFCIHLFLEVMLSSLY